MAVTSIWPIKGRVEDVIKYAKNPEKTRGDNLERIAAMHAIDDVVEYAADEMKTEKLMYVTGVACNAETAIQTFNETRKRWNTKGTRVCYHGYQSFAAGEVDAKTAHDIGVELAKRLWEKRFEVVVATHCNTGHYHNHFVINAVSFADGKKFDNNHEDYRQMREESDRLCKEYGLSVIRRPKEKGMNYAEWQAEKNGQPTLRGSIREAIDIAIRGSMTESEFYDAMDQMGFVIDTHGKYPKIKHVGDDRFVRFKSLGPGYSLDEILDAVYENDNPQRPRYPEQESPQQIFTDYPGVKVASMTYTAVYHCYYKALLITKERPTTNRKVYALVKQEHNRMQSYSDQNTLLSEHHIESPDELRAYKAEALKKIDETVALRQDMRNALKRAMRKGDPVEIEHIKFNIELYSRQLNKLRREVNACDGVMERVDKVKETLYRIESEKFRGKENIKDEHFSRSGRSDRENES